MGCLESKESEPKLSDVELGKTHRESADKSVKNPITNRASDVSRDSASQARSPSKPSQNESPSRQMNTERQSEDLKIARPVSVNRGSESTSTPPRPVSLAKQPSKLSELLQAEKLKASGIQHTTVLLITVIPDIISNHVAVYGVN